MSLGVGGGIGYEKRSIHLIYFHVMHCRTFLGLFVAPPPLSKRRHIFRVLMLWEKEGIPTKVLVYNGLVSSSLCATGDYKL